MSTPLAAKPKQDILRSRRKDEVCSVIAIEPLVLEDTGGLAHDVRLLFPVLETLWEASFECHEGLLCS